MELRRLRLINRKYLLYFPAKMVKFIAEMTDNDAAAAQQFDSAMPKL